MTETLFTFSIPYLGDITFSASSVVSLLGIIVSLFASLIAIGISIKSLRQNSQMIEDSSRPYVTMYIGDTYFSSLTVYFILKNFGNSSAKIADFSTSLDFKNIAYDTDRVPLTNIIGTTLCPGESLRFPVDLTKLPDEVPNINITIKYQSSEHSYEENTILNLAAHCDALHLRANTRDQHLKEISFALQDIAEKML